MSRIVKSSYITIGNKKEINTHSSFEVEEDIVRNGIKIDLEQARMEELEKNIALKLIEAEEQARLIIENAHQQANDIFTNARIEGYNLGKEQGYHDGQQEANMHIQEALDIKREILATKSKIAKDIENEIVELALHITEKILNTKIEDCNELMIGLVKLGLEKCTYTESLAIRVSPEDYGYMISVKDRIVCLVENIQDLTVKQDASLKKGSCIIDTPSGSVDSSIDMQLKQIVEVFKQLLESE